MDVVSEELLLMIFSWLKTDDLIRCSQVNRKWRRITQEKTLWRTIDLSSCSVPLRSLGKLVEEHGEVRSLILKQSMIMDPHYWQNSIPRNHLQRIDLSGVTASYGALKHILRSSYQLTYLNMRHSVITCSNVAYQGTESNAQLRQRVMRRTTHSCYVLQIIFNDCKVLEEVDLGIIHDPMYTLLITKSPPSTLRRLRLECADLAHSNEIVHSVPYCPNLTHLDIIVRASALRRELAFNHSLLVGVREYLQGKFEYKFYKRRNKIYLKLRRI